MTLKVGQRFSSYEEFVRAVNEFGLKTNAVFTIADCKKNPPGSAFKYKFLKLGCKHYGKQRVNSRGIRPNQKSFKTGCSVNVLAKPFESCVAIMALETEHNHVCSSELVENYPERRKLSAQEIEKVKVLIEHDVKPAKLQNFVRKFTGKNVNVQDLSNLRYSIRQSKSENQTPMEETLGMLCKVLNDDADATVIIGKKSKDKPLELIDLRHILEKEKTADILQTVDIEESCDDTEDDINDSNQEEEGTLEFLFLQTGAMKKTFSKYPEVVLMDNTYNVTNNRMPLNIIMAMDSYGCGRVISYTFICNEKQSTIATTLRCLKAANESAFLKVTCVGVDKDFSEINAIRSVFPQDVLIDLCSFHVQKNFKEATASIAKPEEKEKTRKILTKILYSESSDEYDDYVAEFELSAPKDVRDYFFDNWHKRNEAWVVYEKLLTPNYGNFTNNRVENHNCKIKEVLNRHCSLLEAIQGLLLLHENKEYSVSFNQYLCTSKISYVVGNTDPDVAAIVTHCTPFAAKLLRSQIADVDREHAYVADGHSCTCVFYKSFHLPCRHIFWKRKQEGEPKFVLEEIPQRWLKSYDPEFTPQRNTNLAENIVVDIPHQLTKTNENQKFRESFEVGKKISNILCRNGSKQFLQRLHNYQKLHDIWERGNEVVIMEVTPENAPDPEDECVSQLTPQSSIPKVQNNVNAHDDREVSESGLPGVMDAAPLCVCKAVVVKKFCKTKNSFYYSCGSRNNKCEYHMWLNDEQQHHEVDPSNAGPLKKLAACMTLAPKLKVRGRPKGSDLTVMGTKRVKGQSTKPAVARSKKVSQSTKKGVGSTQAPLCKCQKTSIRVRHTESDENFGRELYRCAKQKCTLNLWCSTYDEAVNAPRNDGNSQHMDSIEEDEPTETVAQSPPGGYYVPKCKCNAEAIRHTVRRRNVNFGREFFSCSKSSCDFFRWVDRLTNVEPSQIVDDPLGGDETHKEHVPSPKENAHDTESSLETPLVHDNDFRKDIDSVDFALEDLDFPICLMCKNILIFSDNGECFCQNCNGSLGEVVSSIHINDQAEGSDSDNKNCCVCGLEAGSHRCSTCGKTVHAIGTCSESAPGSEEGYGQSRLCRNCGTPQKKANSDPLGKLQHKADFLSSQHHLASTVAISADSGGTSKENLCKALPTISEAKPLKRKQASITDFLKRSKDIQAVPTVKERPPFKKLKQLVEEPQNSPIDVILKNTSILKHQFQDVTFEGTATNCQDSVFFIFDETRQNYITAVIPKPGSSNYTVFIYDSMQTEEESRLSWHIQMKLAAVYKEKGAAISVFFQRCQQTKDTLHAAFLAVAYAVEFCFTRKLRSPLFKIDQLQSHSQMCFKEGTIKPFPKTSLSEKCFTSSVSKESFNVFCICRLPQNFDKSDNWIGCENCGEWFHYECVEVSKEPEGAWFCMSCTSSQ